MLVALIYTQTDEICHQLKCYDFFHNPITSILILTFFGISLRILLASLNYETYCFIPEAIVVVGFIGLVLEVPHIKNVILDDVRITIEKALYANNENNPPIEPYNKNTIEITKAFNTLFENKWSLQPYLTDDTLPCYFYQGKWERDKVGYHLLIDDGDYYIYYTSKETKLFTWC